MKDAEGWASLEEADNNWQADSRLITNSTTILGYRKKQKS